MFFFLPSRAVLSAILRDEYLTSAVRTKGDNPKLLETYRNQWKLEVMCMLTNVAKTHDVPLDVTIFLSNTGHKDRATSMNKNIPIELS